MGYAMRNREIQQIDTDGHKADDDLVAMLVDERTDGRAAVNIAMVPRVLQDVLYMRIRGGPRQALRVHAGDDTGDPARRDRAVGRGVMARADWHTFQILTKRDDRLAELAADLPWPPNVWMGVTNWLSTARVKARLAQGPTAPCR